ISELRPIHARRIGSSIWSALTCPRFESDCCRAPNRRSFSVSRSQLVNQRGRPRGSALVFAQRSMRVVHKTLARLAIAQKIGNGALERVGIADLDRACV